MKKQHPEIKPREEREPRSLAIRRAADAVEADKAIKAYQRSTEEARERLVQLRAERLAREAKSN